MKGLMIGTVLTSVVAAGAVAALVASHYSTANESALTEERVNEIVAQYVSDGGGAIMEAVQKHQMAEREREQQSQQELARQYHEQIYNAPHSPTVGPENAVVSIVEFYDYNCPACKQMFTTLDTVMQKYPEKLRVIFKEFPIFGQQSIDNAKAAFAVNALAPEKFFDWHRIMMTHEGRADLAFALAAAGEIGLNPDDVAAEMEKPEIEGYVNEDTELARAMVIRGTPALIVGDAVVNSAMPASELELLIEQFEAARNEALKAATGGVIQDHSVEE